MLPPQRAARGSTINGRTIPWAQLLSAQSAVHCLLPGGGGGGLERIDEPPQVQCPLTGGISSEYPCGLSASTSRFLGNRFGARRAPVDGYRAWVFPSSNRLMPVLCIRLA